MKKVIVRADQDIFDICIQEFGSLEQIDIVINDNNLNFSGDIVQGQELIINNEDVGNEDIKDFYELRQKHPKNSITDQATDETQINFDNDEITWDSTLISFDQIIEL